MHLAVPLLLLAPSVAAGSVPVLHVVAEERLQPELILALRLHLPDVQVQPASSPGTEDLVLRVLPSDSGCKYMLEDASGEILASETLSDCSEVALFCSFMVDR